jgi:hypothetical protein
MVSVSVVKIGRVAMLAGGVAAMLAAGAMGGCENMEGGWGGKRQPVAQTDAFVKPAVNGTDRPAKAAPKASLSRAEQQREEMNQAAVDTQAAFDMLNARGSGIRTDQDLPATPAPNRPQSRGNGRIEPLPSLSLTDMGSDVKAGLAGTTVVPAAANRPASVPDATVPTHVADRSPEQRRADAVFELSQQLRPDIGASKQPLRAAVPLFGLDAISPGSAQDGLDAMRAAVSPDQRRVLDATGDLFKSLVADPNLASGDPAAVANAMRSQADRLAGGPQTDGEDMSLGTVSLCQQVNGFGRYTPLRSNAFMAGRAGSLILYTEVEHFAQSPLSGGPAGEGDDGPRWMVELGQSVKLYFDADGSEQMSLPETVVKDLSRAKRHDFFLVQRIDLPRVLSVGNYTLKVTVRDVASGGMAEQLTSIRIIADGSVARDRVPAAPSKGSKGAAGSGRLVDGRP